MRLPRRVPTFTLGVAAALLGGWFVFPSLLYEKIQQPLSFNHALHTSDAVGLSCQDCHSFDEAGRFSGIPSTKSCANCHEEPLGESETERVLVVEYLQPGCEVPWLIYARQPDNVRFSHAIHVELARIECARCHGKHGSQSSLRPLQRNRVSGYSRDIWGASISRFTAATSPRMKMGDCCDCHRKSGVSESCLDCHR
jgi:hypothetical protein